MNNTSFDINFDKILEKVFDSFKRLTPALFALSLMTGLVLFLPDSILIRLGLSDLPSSVRIIIGVVFLLSTVLIITIVLFGLFNLIVDRIKNTYLRKRLEKQYYKLSKNQKIIINQLCKSKTKSIKLNYTSGDTRYLVAKGFILSPRQTIVEDDVYNNIQIFCAQPWLIELYEKKPNIFEL